MYIYNYNIYIPGKPKKHNMFLWLWKNTHNDRFFCKIYFFKKKTIVKSKEHSSPTRGKTVFFRHVVEQTVKNIATLTQVAPDDQSRNDKRNGQGRSTKNIIIVFQVDIDTVLILI